ncbi:TetR/AcrR family transcriptional regulator [Dactylosporangium fulvum]|uniref:TetR family transcriptional regulator n=1 Tax=Dactylosporangium fulvum TaxID=53359 RepID=A0ABY5VP07_9ACTN|nr:TetR family transcriptional regulator [Dactylosporangium fulvum]UWP78494.1 TetR family transcriptional regulator [Dactylosporangium fulvum]
MTQGTGRPLRADAERNRRLVLQTAGRMLAERGTAVTLNEVAREAGVGVGTVYRRFPDLQALINTLYAERLTTFRQLAADAAQQEEPGRALRHYLLAAATRRAEDPALELILEHASLDQPEIAEMADELGRRVDGLVERAVAAGAVRADFTSSDAYNLLYMLGTVSDRTEQIAPGNWRRYAEVLLTGFGLQASPAERTEAMTDEQMRQAVWPRQP